MISLVHPVHRRVAVVDGVGVAAVGVDPEGAVGANQHEAAAAIGHASYTGALLDSRADAGDAALGRQGRVVAIDVAVVGEHIAAGVGARRTVVSAASFKGCAGVVACDRGIIRPIDGDAQHADVGEAAKVSDRVVELFLQAVAGAEGVDEWIAVVNDVGVGAVGVDGEGAVGPTDHKSASAIWRPRRAGSFAGTGSDSCDDSI